MIRLRGNTWITLDDGHLRYLAAFNVRMPRGTTRFYPETVLYDGLTLNLVCHRPAKGERVLLLKRWSIETAFGCLKSKGFNVEDTLLTHPPRLHLLLGLLAWTLLWALLVGEQLYQKKPIKRKKHGRRAISLFRLGLDQLTQITHQTREQRKQAQRYEPPFYCRVLRALTMRAGRSYPEKPLLLARRRA